jgi:hypothetical protein
MIIFAGMISFKDALGIVVTVKRTVQRGNCTVADA